MCSWRAGRRSCRELCSGGLRSRAFWQRLGSGDGCDGRQARARHAPGRLQGRGAFLESKREREREREIGPGKESTARYEESMLEG